MRVRPTPDDLVELTAAWSGERFPDGRPRVPDEVLRRLAGTTTEQAWGVLVDHGHPRQFAGGWRQTHPGTGLVGRAVTSQFLPHRPDYDGVVVRAGAREGHAEGDRQNSWIIESLVDGDVMVTDIFGKVVEGTVIGDNLGSALAARTRAGAVIDGGIRDLPGIAQLEQVNVFYRDTDPTPIRHVTLHGINVPVRIDGVTVLPGDVVLGTVSGVTFIPAHLAEEVAATSDAIRIRDQFGQARLAAGVYRSSEIDVATWAPHIEADYQQWQADRAPA
jgi:4-hydroxy-4-methyl-2-oxoglutarate aldolase